MNKKKIKEKLSDIGFVIFYSGLFILQIIPSFAILYLDKSNPWLWISCVVGVVAMIVQAINFECHSSMFWRAGMIGGALSAVVLRYYL